MERKTAGLLGALAGLATLGGTGAQAATDATLKPEPLAVTSYADLLRPIPDATRLLQNHNVELQTQAAKTAGVLTADWNGNNGNGHHHNSYAPPPPRHHHHHNSYYQPPPPPHHHHHHHHQGGAVIVVPGIGVRIN